MATVSQTSGSSSTTRMFRLQTGQAVMRGRGSMIWARGANDEIRNPKEIRGPNDENASSCTGSCVEPGHGFVVRPADSARRDPREMTSYPFDLRHVNAIGAVHEGEELVALKQFEIAVGGEEFPGDLFVLLRFEAAGAVHENAARLQERGGLVH